MRFHNKNYRRLRTEVLEGRLLLAGDDLFDLTPQPRQSPATFGPAALGDFQWTQPAGFPLAAGATYQGEFDTPGKVQEFQLRAGKSGRLTISASAADGSSLDCLLSLYGPDQDGQLLNLLVQSDDVSLTDASALIDQHVVEGTYRLEVSASPSTDGASSVGQYALTTEWQPSAASLDLVPAEGQPWAITSADFNGDGHLDLATANAWSSDVSIMLGLGDGTFYEQVRYDVGTSPGSIAAGDFNGDTWADLAVGNAGSDSVSILLGNGDGTFRVAPATLAVGDEPAVIAVADINGDGRDDLIVPSKAGGDVRVFLSAYGTGDSLILYQHIVPKVLREEVGLDPAEKGKDPYVKTSFRSVALAHLNDDDHLDLVVTFKKYDCVVVFLGNDDAKFDRGQVVLVGDNLPDNKGVDDGTSAVALADYNGDGHLDLVTANDTSDSVSVRFGNGDGTFRNGKEDGEEYIAGDDTEFLLTAQLNDDNGDGVVDDRDYPDVITGNEDSRDLTILLSRGPTADAGQRAFHEPTSIPVHSLPDEIVAGDFNSDGRTDLAVASRDGQVLVLLGLGDGTFQHDGRFGVGDDPEAIVYGDFNGDGLMDVATANGRSNDVSVLLGRGDGTFEPDRRFSLQSADNSDNVPDTAKTGPIPHAIVAHDFNRDGHLDLATANEHSDNVSILLGLGNGDFASPSHVAVGDSPWSLVVMDLDGDGFADLATANRRDNSVSILFGKGDGTFKEHTEFGVGAFPELIVAKDFDNDGRIDLGTVNRLSHDVSVLYGRGGPGEFDQVTLPEFPSLAEPFDYSVVSGWIEGSVATKTDDDRNDIRFFPRVVVTGDFNNDGDVDIAAADDRANEVSIFLGHGDGTYEPALRLPTGNDPEWMSTGHFNDDEYEDLILSLDHGAAVSILLGSGNGSFIEGDTYELPSGSEKVLVGDLNGDGKDDLACAVGRKLGVLIGKGDGTFEPPRVESAGTAGEAMAMADFDGDSVLDIAYIDGKQNPLELKVRYGLGNGEFQDGLSVLQLPEPQITVKSLTSADLDNDGRPDLVAADLTTHRLFVFWNLGKGGFESQELELGDHSISSPWDASVRPVVAVDFDGDGLLDLATVNEFFGNISVVLNRGEQEDGQEFQIDEENQTYWVGTGPGALASADVNHDGIADLIVGNQHSFDISILLGNGDGTFQPQTRIAAGQEPASSVTVDFNGDGRPDQAQIDDNLNYVSLLLNVGEGNLVDSRSISAEIRLTPVLADFNGDGAPDSVQINLRGDILVRMGTNDGSGPFVPPQIVNPTDPARDFTVVSTANETFLAALNRRTKDGQGSVTLYELGQDGRFEVYMTLPDGVFPTQIESADLNGDGQDDLVVRGGDSAEVSVFLGDGSGGFSPNPVSVFVGQLAGHLTLLDIGGPDGALDGLIDIVVVSAASGSVGIMLNEGKKNGEVLSFRPELRLRAATGLSGVSPDGLVVQSRAQTSGLASGDFNNDGIVDLVMANHGLNSASILFGKPGGGFVDPESFFTGSGPTEVQAADFNEDGNLDLAILNRDEASLSVVMGDGTGSFDSDTPYVVDVGESASGILIDDLDGDGHLDLLVANDWGDLLVLQGSGDGHFEPFASPGTNVAMAVADFNEDGQEDVAVVDEQSSSLKVWLADGERFSEIPIFTQGRANGLVGPKAVDVFDLNHDGHADIVVTNTGANGILVLLGKGDGRFEEPQSFETGMSPVGLAATDLDHDGRLDLVVANYLSNYLTVLLGDADPEVLLNPGPRPLLQITGGDGGAIFGTGPTSIETGDYNDDGWVDLIVSNEVSGNTFLFLSRGQGFFAEGALFADEPIPLEQAGQVIIGPFGAREGNELAIVDQDTGNLWLYANAFPQFVGSFSPPATSGLPVLASYFNEDATLDLAVLDQQRRLISVFSLNTSLLSHTGAVGADSAGGQDWHPGGLSGLGGALATKGLSLASLVIQIQIPSTMSPPSAWAIAGSQLNPRGFVLMPADGDFPVLVSFGQTPTTIVSWAPVPQGLSPDEDLWRIPRREQRRREPRSDGPPSEQEEGKREGLIPDFAPRPGSKPSKLGNKESGGTLPDKTGHEGEGRDGPANDEPGSGRNRRPTYGLKFPERPQPPETRRTDASEHTDILDWVTDISGTIVDHLIALFGGLARWAGKPDGDTPVASVLSGRAVDAVIGQQTGELGVLNDSSAHPNVAVRLDRDHEDGPSTYEVIAVAAAMAWGGGVYFAGRRPRDDDDELPAKTVLHPTRRSGKEQRPLSDPAKEQRTNEASTASVMSTEDFAMDMDVKEFLPRSWWEVADCIETYENARKTGSSDLRAVAGRVSPDHHTQAITELAAVDMEYRWEAGEPKTVEQYLADFPEILVDSQYPEELIAQEYQVRCECGEQPTLDEYRRRFPDYDVERAISQLDADMCSVDVSPGGGPAGDSDRPCPEMIGRYRVIEEIGSGAFGRVYRCYDTRLKREVAVKLPHATGAPKAQRLQEFLHEARSAARLQHPGVVSVLDAGELEDGQGFVVYEFVAGQTLRQRIKADSYARQEAVRWCTEIAEALHYAHTHQIVHRDVSPDNVLIDEQGKVRLTDFGLSKRDDQYYRDDSGRVLGSPAYISPEQAGANRSGPPRDRTSIRWASFSTNC